MRPITRNYKHCMRSTTHKTGGYLFRKLTGKVGTDSRPSLELCASNRSGSLAAASTAAVVTSRHDQYPGNTTVGTKITDVVAVAAKADGRVIRAVIITCRKLHYRLSART